MNNKNDELRRILGVRSLTPGYSIGGKGLFNSPMASDVWQEHKHPRNDIGRFTDKAKAAPSAPEKGRTALEEINRQNILNSLQTGRGSLFTQTGRAGNPNEAGEYKQGAVGNFVDKVSGLFAGNAYAGETSEERKLSELYTNSPLKGREPGDTVDTGANIPEPSLVGAITFIGTIGEGKAQQAIQSPEAFKETTQYINEMGVALTFNPELISKYKKPRLDHLNLAKKANTFYNYLHTEREYTQTIPLVIPGSNKALSKKDIEGKYSELMRRNNLNVDMHNGTIAVYNKGGYYRSLSSQWRRL